MAEAGADRIETPSGAGRSEFPDLLEKAQVNMRLFALHRIVGRIAAVVLIAPLVAVASASGAHAATASQLVSLASANLGNGECSTNSLGGTGYYASCGADAGEWCADFARWVWMNSGVSDSDGDLSAAAASFVNYGNDQGTLHLPSDGAYTPQVGDAVVFGWNGDYGSAASAQHVAIVTGVSGGEITSIGGNEGGGSGTVDQDGPYSDSFGYSSYMGMDISAYISPVGLSSAALTYFWYLSNSNTSGVQTTARFGYGNTPMIPLSGDWTDKGYDTPGVYDPTDSTFDLANTFDGGVANTAILFGDPGDEPVVGDWDGPSHGTEVGVYRPSTASFYLRRDDGSVTVIPFGDGAGWYPIAGDWTGKGYDSIGLFQPSSTGGPNTFYLRNSLTGGVADITLTLGNPGDEPIVGDWDNNGHTSIGVYRPSTYTYYFEHSSGSPATPTGLTSVAYGDGGSQAVIGHWSVGAADTIGAVMTH